MLKILKSCTSSKATSYKVKFAVNSMLAGVDPDKIGMGQAVRRVMEYRTIKNKFGSIHPDLEREGYTGVKVTDTGFVFLRSNQGWLSIVRNKTELIKYFVSVVKEENSAEEAPADEDIVDDDAEVTPCCSCQ